MPAARRARERLAYEECLRWCELGLDALSFEPDHFNALRSDLLLETSRAHIQIHGPATAEARAAAVRAAAADPEVERLLEESLQTVVARSALRVELMAALAIYKTQSLGTARELRRSPRRRWRRRAG